MQLHIAAANNYRDVGKVLLDKGAEIDPMDDEGMTPLHVASKFGNLKMVKLLVRRNANPGVVNFEMLKPVGKYSSTHSNSSDWLYVGYI